MTAVTYGYARVSKADDESKNKDLNESQGEMSRDMG